MAPWSLRLLVILLLFRATTCFAADNVASFVKGVNSLSAHFCSARLIVSLTHIVLIMFIFVVGGYVLFCSLAVPPS